LKEAVKYINFSLSIAKDLDIIYPMQNILQIATIAEYRIGNYKAAADHLSAFQKIKDSVQSLNAATNVALMSAQYQFDKSKDRYNHAIKEQKKKGLIWAVTSIILFSVMLLVFYLFRIVYKERQNSDKLLLNILPYETAKELKKYGKATAKKHENVSIIFADIENFTLLASKCEPAIIVAMLDRYFKLFDHVVEKNELEKIKTIGDAYLFVSGLTKNEKNNAVEAIKACLEIIEAISREKQAIEEAYGISFNFRFGVNTGDIVSGVVGEKKYAFDVWGDAVNLAARMETASETGKINITEKTYLQIKNNYACIPRGEIEAKNKGKIKMFFVEKPID